MTGDPEREVEPRGWEQLLSFFEASWRRAGAPLSPEPTAAYDEALMLASTSMDIVFDDAALPIRRGLNAQSQRVGTLVDHCASLQAAGLRDDATKSAKVADGELAQLTQSWSELGDTIESAEHAAQTQSGMLSAARHGWRLAIVTRDIERFNELRERVAALTRSSGSGFAVEKLYSLERASEALTGKHHDVGADAPTAGSRRAVGVVERAARLGPFSREPDCVANAGDDAERGRLALQV